MFPICNNCLKRVHLVRGKKKTIANQRDASFFSIRLKKQFENGNVICGRCRLEAYKVENREKTNPCSSTNTSVHSPQPHSHRSPSLEIEKSSETSDEEEFLPTSSDEDVVEVPLRRVVATHAYCFLCGAKNNLQRVNLELRCSVYKKTHIYIPDGMELPNSLNEEVQIQRWNRKKSKLQKLDSSMLLDFPRLNEDQLKVLFTGSYQMSLAVCYLAEILDEHNNLSVFYIKESPSILKMDVRSRHINSKYYRVYIDYVPGGNDVKDIQRYCCDCANGLRTVGCCAHVSCIIYYLSYAKYLSKIVRPAEILSHLFCVDNINAVINENSEDDE